jgi:hypothetical protein
MQETMTDFNSIINNENLFESIVQNLYEETIDMVQYRKNHFKIPKNTKAKKVLKKLAKNKTALTVAGGAALLGTGYLLGKKGKSKQKPKKEETKKLPLYS